MAPLACASFFYAREFFPLPAFDFGFVAFPRSTFGLLTAPMQEFLQDLPHMSVMVLNFETPLDQIGHTLGSPQFVGPTVSFGSLPKKKLQFMKLKFGQVPWGPGMGDGIQSIRFAARHAAPAVE